MTNEKKNVYVVLSQTGTLLSRILKKITGAQYNHASICLDDSFQTLYSFGRRHSYNPVQGAFVKESPNDGTFKRFKNTDAVVLRFRVVSEEHDRLKSYIEHIYAHKRLFHYNYLGLFLALFGKGYHKRRHYYCSEFVADMLLRFGIVAQDCFDDIIKPIDFLQLSDAEVIYCGRLTSYPALKA